MKRLIFLLFIGLAVKSFGQCDTNVAVLSGTIDSVSSQTKDSAFFAFDDEQSTFWATNSATTQELIYNFGKVVHLNGVMCGMRYQDRLKPNRIEVHTSDDGETWESKYLSGDLFFFYQDYFVVNFGTVSTQYVKLTFSAEGAINIAQIRFLEDSCPGEGLKNPIIDFKPIEDHYTQVGTIDLEGAETSGMPVFFSVLQGDVTIKDNKINTDGFSGTVIIGCMVPSGAGNYSSIALRTFNLYDEEDYQPEAWISITDDYPLELKTWEAYPIYMRAEMNDILGTISIKDMELYIDGKQVSISQDADQSFYSYHLWRPQEYKTYEIEMVVEGQNGITRTITQNVEVVKGAESQQVTTLDDVVIWFQRENSRNYQGNYTLPQHVGVYDKITANLEVECPDGNCDDWDRWAYIDVMAPDGNWIQIIRYITPYGVGCDHSIDLTQYASLLQGNVPIRVFIDTWGTGGWQLTLTLDFQAGEPEYLYSNVKEIWDGTYDFGNPANLQPVEEVTYEVVDGVEDARLYLSTTGHGWGENNSNNAAEFYQAIHNIDFNGIGAYQQDLWDRCNPNPDGCTGQKGTWQYDRAGWCPGAIAPPDVFELMNVVEGSSFKLHYRFDEAYEDECHPNNPDCVTGRTCKDCNAGYNPHYQIDAHAVSYSNQVLIYNDRVFQSTPDHVAETLGFEVFPNPARETFRLSGFETDERFKVSIRSVDGRTHAFYYFNNSDEALGTSFNIESLDGGVYFIQVEGQDFSGYQSIVVE